MPDHLSAYPATEGAGAGGNDMHWICGYNTGAHRPAARRERRSRAGVPWSWCSWLRRWGSPRWGSVSPWSSVISSARHRRPWRFPTPATQNLTFVEDDDGTGADSQANILQLDRPWSCVHRIEALHWDGCHSSPPPAWCSPVPGGSRRAGKRSCQGTAARLWLPGHDRAVRSGAPPHVCPAAQRRWHVPPGRDRDGARPGGW